MACKIKTNKKVFADFNLGTNSDELHKNGLVIKASWERDMKTFFRFKLQFDQSWESKSCDNSSLCLANVCKKNKYFFNWTELQHHPI